MARGNRTVLGIVTTGMTPPPLPPLPAPAWPHCGEGATTVDPTGCRGRQVPGESLCLAHVAPATRATHLAALSPGDDIDHRGTTFAGSLLNELLNVLRDPASGLLRLGRAQFKDATFSADAEFSRATFSTHAHFDGATFSAGAWFTGATFFADAQFDGATFSADAGFRGTTFSAQAWFGRTRFSAEAEFSRATFSAGARFTGATFSANARFDRATFSTHAWFDGAAFSDNAWFTGATFSAGAWFGRAAFSAGALFGRATFSTHAWFDGVAFSDNAQFDGATFSAAPLLGPLVCQGRLDLSGAAFVAPLTIEATAVEVRCVRTRWESTATLQLRYAEVDLSDAVVTQPIAVTAHTAPFVTGGGSVVDETALTHTAGVQRDPGVRISSLRGVDAAHLVLTNTDLTGCRFFGAFHLDQLRLEGETVFARTPVGTDVRRGIPLRWTDRLTLAEEHHWRALPEQRPRLRAGWTPAPPEPGPAACPPGPPALAALYRQLRKAFEDGKDEPGAADFYYAEMEMRRLGPPRSGQHHRPSRQAQGQADGLVPGPVGPPAARGQPHSRQHGGAGTALPARHHHRDLPVQLIWPPPARETHPERGRAGQGRGPCRRR
ncbi:pentapeptide repeat-containing protein [Streptomyces sp. NPDC057705]|uniref:pentapeptide repeat-containing protein n=1 Tax=Streptomyces sp. NPDC057705 TaxID=3346222 RepID=UPI0036D0E2CD